MASRPTRVSFSDVVDTRVIPNADEYTLCINRHDTASLQPALAAALAAETWTEIRVEVACTSADHWSAVMTELKDYDPCQRHWTKQGLHHWSRAPSLVHMRLVHD
jgi:hypothetical protein